MSLDLFRGPSADRPLVRCHQCPGQPVLPTHNSEIDTRRCVRCQGERRWLPQPHPDNHLCEVCERECPRCQALTPQADRLCRSCQGLCRTCNGPLPERPATPKVTHVAPTQRKDGKHRWTKSFYERTWDQDQCLTCRAAASGADAVRAVLASLPPKLLRACGGGVSSTVVSCIRDQLDYLPAAVLQARIDRRWWGRWATLPLHKSAEGDRDGYRPDDVALWLVESKGCHNRCEDGWFIAAVAEPDADDKPCPVCNGAPAASEGTRQTDEYEDTVPSTGADRTVLEAVAHRPFQECTGKDGTCGLPVQHPYTQCPACMGWPHCGCGRRRYNPAAATRCTTCATRPATPVR
jgi:hypothetical protein